MTEEELLKIISRKEGLKLDFKREYKLDKKLFTITDTNTQVIDKQVKEQWDEFIKDILALTNGNIGTSYQTGYLIIGVGDTLYSDGRRDLFDTSVLNLTEAQILQKVNSACNPPIHDIHCSRIDLEGKSILVIAMPPSRHVHETTRSLKRYSERTVFVRRNETTEPATNEERESLKKEKSTQWIEIKNLMSTDEPYGYLRQANTTLVIPLVADEVTLGKDTERCLVAIPKEFKRVSRIHAKIIRHIEGIFIEDFGSKNGTYLNGKLIDEAVKLQDSYIISLGGPLGKPGTCSLEFSFKPPTNISVTEMGTQF